MDPISIRITFQDFPPELNNYLLCLFYLVSILLCTIILSSFAYLFNYLTESFRNKEYIYISNEDQS